MEELTKEADKRLYERYAHRENIKIDHVTRYIGPSASPTSRARRHPRKRITFALVAQTESISAAELSEELELPNVSAPAPVARSAPVVRSRPAVGPHEGHAPTSCRQRSSVSPG